MKLWRKKPAQDATTVEDPTTPEVAAPVVATKRNALRRSAGDEAVDIVRGASAIDRLRHGRNTPVIDPAAAEAPTVIDLTDPAPELISSLD